MTLSLVFDLLLAGVLLLVSWRLLQASDLFQATVLFISFGLFLALAWVRLQAPDIALAEAAVGAGLAGVLLFGTFKRIEPQSDHPDQSGQSGQSSQERGPGDEPFVAGSCRLDQVAACPSRFHYLVAGLGAVALTALLVLAVLELPRHEAGLAGMVAQKMGSSGVEHPVTAVLLNFRLYDTWLELGVLLLALMGVFGVRGAHDLRGLPMRPTASPVARRLVGLLGPLVVLVAAYLLWLGDHAPGGAFQAGVVLAAGLVLLRLTGLPSVDRLSRTALLSCVVVGFAAILLLAVLTALAPQGFPLEYPSAWAGTLILALEAAATVSIGVTLAALVAVVLVVDE
ncbi:hydrogenase subunit MbhD domain-containing protein [Desulfonatronum sp. SC1]|uniref:hydrogenase subunit MbhD domain-containing protein n=1 Tax=Desulfonatronum sp. SC1 TaxID=2109626 RepID=UPI000D2F66D3|nr:hydrogenase subunit MbhD domain-containing protein [Desulfonatronum sp. SC1]PTN35315.1 sodium:proton antiporter [Desulfonatronum sp. SC1]